MKKLSELLNKSQSVALNTKDENGHPFSSYASFYYEEGLIYISIPKISTHVENIGNDSKVFTLFVEDMSVNKPALDRHKITLECDVKMISKEDFKFKEIMPKFEGGTLDILIGIEGFNLYALTPVSGEVTFGLGETLDIFSD